MTRSFFFFFLFSSRTNTNHLFFAHSISGVDQGGAPACVPCPAGSSTTIGGEAVCTLCQPGFYSSAAGVFFFLFLSPSLFSFSLDLRSFFASNLVLPWTLVTTPVLLGPPAKSHVVPTLHPTLTELAASQTARSPLQYPVRVFLKYNHHFFLLLMN